MGWEDFLKTIKKRDNHPSNHFMGRLALQSTPFKIYYRV